MENIKLSPIRNFHDALKVRKIRNEARGFMTNDTSEIGLAKQLKWYFGTYRKKNEKKRMFCFLLKLNRSDIGFGLIRENKGKFWITGGLSPDHRGKGLGKVLFGEIVKAVPSKEVWLEVLDTNMPAKKIYEKLGFKVIEENTLNKEVNIMKLKNK